MAKALGLPLNAIVPRKIGAPGSPELAIGAILEGGNGYFNDSLIEALGVEKEYLEKEIEKETATAKERLARYRQHAPMPVVKNKTVILVDDGIATGATMFASIAAMRKEGAKKIVVAVPVASRESLEEVEKLADETICLDPRDDLFSISMFYRHFEQVEDETVAELLQRAHR